MAYYDAQGREIEDAEGDNMRRDRAEAEARALPYIAGYYAVECDGEYWYPCHWVEDDYMGRPPAWQPFHHVGYFEITVLRFPTPGEAWDWVYHQGDHQGEG